LVRSPNKGSRADRERDADRHVGNRLRLIRTELGVSLDELSRRSKISATHLAKCEAGERRMSPLVLSEMSDALGVGIHEFFYGLD
jgi:transcriptional regulator with XRE-family HTH domain